jgi:hypothetical protein
MTDSEQIREFFHRMANGLTISVNSESSRNNRFPRSTERCNETVGDTEKDFGVGLPPLAGH